MFSSAFGGMYEKRSPAIKNVEVRLSFSYSEQTVLTFPGLGNEAPAQQNCKD